MALALATVALSLNLLGHTGGKLNLNNTHTGTVTNAACFNLFVSRTSAIALITKTLKINAEIKILAPVHLNKCDFDVSFRVMAAAAHLLVLESSATKEVKGIATASTLLMMLLMLLSINSLFTELIIGFPFLIVGEHFVGG